MPLKNVGGKKIIYIGDPLKQCFIEDKNLLNIIFDALRKFYTKF